MGKESFTINTTQDYVTEFLTESLKKRDKFAMSGSAESVNRSLRLTAPEWGNHNNKFPPHIFGVFGKYTSFVDGQEYYHDRPFIVFDFKAKSPERLLVTMSYDDDEPLVVVYAKQLLRFIVEEYSECKNSFDPPTLSSKVQYLEHKTGKWELNFSLEDVNKILYQIIKHYGWNYIQGPYAQVW